jgi:hypothetical protein
MSNRNLRINRMKRLGFWAYGGWMALCGVVWPVVAIIKLVDPTWMGLKMCNRYGGNCYMVVASTWRWTAGVMLAVWLVVIVACACAYRTKPLGRRSPVRSKSH